MKKIIVFFERIITYLSIFYIKFVYKTSKIIISGEDYQLNPNNEEKFILAFWHGSSYTLYPCLKGKDLYVITTQNGRGNYITTICENFGYKTIRVPDESVGGNFLFKIRREINGEKKGNLALTLDGPLGPYHEPKSFPYITAMLTKRRLILVTAKAKREIHLNKRWDKFAIPLPFNKIKIHFHSPMDITKKDLAEDAILLKTNTRNIMEKNMIQCTKKPLRTLYPQRFFYKSANDDQIHFLLHRKALGL